VTFYDVFCKSVVCLPRWNVLAKRDTWEGNIQRFADLRVPPLVTNSSCDNKGRFDCTYYLLYIHVCTYIKHKHLVFCEVAPFFCWALNCISCFPLVPSRSAFLSCFLTQGEYIEVHSILTSCKDDLVEWDSGW